MSSTAVVTDAGPLGVPVVGTVGVLRRAKVGGHVALVRPLLVALDAGNFRVSPSLVEALPRDVGEKIA